MMRDLLFRAYHRDRKVMYFFDLMWGNFKSGGGYIGMSETNDWNTRTFVDPQECDVMQFTGLKDKNGIEIYEGDIVCTKLGNTCEIRWCEVVEKKSRLWITDVYQYTGFALFNLELNRAFHLDDTEMKVIGNIHENPELL